MEEVEGCNASVIMKRHEDEEIYFEVNNSLSFYRRVLY